MPRVGQTRRVVPALRYLSHVHAVGSVACTQAIQRLARHAARQKPRRLVAANKALSAQAVQCPREQAGGRIHPRRQGSSTGVRGPDKRNPRAPLLWRDAHVGHRVVALASQVEIPRPGRPRQARRACRTVRVFSAGEGALAAVYTNTTSETEVAAGVERRAARIRARERGVAASVAIYSEAAAVISTGQVALDGAQPLHVPDGLAKQASPAVSGRTAASAEDPTSRARWFTADQLSIVAPLRSRGAAGLIGVGNRTVATCRVCGCWARGIVAASKEGRGPRHRENDEAGDVPAARRRPRVACTNLMFAHVATLLRRLRPLGCWSTRR